MFKILVVVLVKTCFLRSWRLIFVFLKMTQKKRVQDHPLRKLLDLCTKSLSKEQIVVSRLITIRPVPVAAAANDDGADKDGKDGDEAVDGDQGDEAKKEDVAPQNYYDRNRWKSAVQKLIPEATQIFVYFMDGYQVTICVPHDISEHGNSIYFPFLKGAPRFEGGAMILKMFSF